MTRLERCIMIDASPDDIEDVLSDVRRLPDWFAGVVQAEADDTFPEPGSQVRMTYQVSRFSVPMIQTVLEHEPGRGGASRIDSMVSGTVRVSLEPAPECTRVTMRFEYELPGKGLGLLMNGLVVERLNAHNLEKSLENLKALVEG